jgi:uncharacterized protein YbjT (DUF2867 family)
MILIVGSTGRVGREVARTLLEKHETVRALVRPQADAAKIESLARDGAELTEGDLKDPASLRKACHGIDTVVTTASATISAVEGDSIGSVDGQGQLALVDAAREAGVRHFIYLSFSGNIAGGFPLHDAKRAVERHLQDSGMTWTIVRPSFFMEVWLSPHAGFDPAGGTVRMFGSGDQGVSFVSASDVARFVAGCVGNPAVVNQIIELGGPEPVSFQSVAALFERKLGRTIAREHVPEQALEQQMRGAPDALQRTRAGLALAAARGDAIDVRPALAKVRIRLTTIEEFVGRAASSM